MIGNAISPMFRSGGGAQPTPYGQLFTDNYQRGTLGSNYTANGVTASIVSNQLVTSSGAGSFSNYVAYSGYGQTNLNSWTQTVDWVVPSTALLSFMGVGVQYKTLNSGSSCQCGLLVFAGGLACDARIYINGILLASGGSITCVQGDLMRTTVVFNGATYTVTCDNLTRSTQATVTATADTTTVASIQTQGWFSLFPYQGITTVSNWTCTTNEYKNADYCFLGDSITQGFCASSIANSFPFLVGVNKNKTVLKLGGANNVTQDILNCLAEVIAFKPKKVFLMIGGNDIAFSVPSVTWQANYNSIISQLTSAGIPIVHLYATPRTSTNITSVNTFINGLGVNKIDTYTPLWSGTGTGANPTLYVADLVHPNTSGHATIATTIEANI